MEPNLDLVAQNPLIDRNMNRIFDQERFQRWAEGNTGWPFFDACMRQLRTTGWINFRMRAMMMSCASYNLWLPWRETGEHLAKPIHRLRARDTLVTSRNAIRYDRDQYN